MMKDIVMDRKDIIKFARKVFRTLNGVVNPVLESSGIEFAKPKIDKATNMYDSNDAIATSICSRVYFNPNILLYYQQSDDKYCSSKEDVKGLIIDSVVHELGHLNQEIDQYLYDRDLDYRAKTESANELFTKAFIVSSIEELGKRFGHFTVYMDYPYNDTTKVTHDDYHFIVSVRKNLFYLLKSIFNGRIFDLVNDMSKTLHTVRFRVINTRRETFTEIPIDELLNSEITAKRLFMFFESTIYSSTKPCMESTIGIDGDVLEFVIELYDDGEHEKKSRSRTMMYFNYCDELKSYSFGRY